MKKMADILLALTKSEALSLYMHLATNCPSKELGAIHRRLERIFRKTQALKNNTVERAAYSVDEFCEAYGITRVHFYKLLKLGLGPVCMKLGKRRLISIEAAAAWREARAERNEI